MPSSIGQHALPPPRPSARQRPFALHSEAGVGLAVGAGVGRRVTVVGDAEGAGVGGPSGDADGAGVGEAVGAAVTGAGVGALSQHSWYVLLSIIGQHRDLGVSGYSTAQAGRCPHWASSAGVGEPVGACVGACVGRRDGYAVGASVLLQHEWYVLKSSSGQHSSVNRSANVAAHAGCLPHTAVSTSTGTFVYVAAKGGPPGCSSLGSTAHPMHHCPSMIEKYVQLVVAAHFAPQWESVASVSSQPPVVQVLNRRSIECCGHFRVAKLVSTNQFCAAVGDRVGAGEPIATTRSHANATHTGNMMGRTLHGRWWWPVPRNSSSHSDLLHFSANSSSFFLSRD